MAQKDGSGDELAYRRLWRLQRSVVDARAVAENDDSVSGGPEVGRCCEWAKWNGDGEESREKWRSWIGLLWRDEDVALVGFPRPSSRTHGNGGLWRLEHTNGYSVARGQLVVSIRELEAVSFAVVQAYSRNTHAL